MSSYTIAENAGGHRFGGAFDNIRKNIEQLRTVMTKKAPKEPAPSSVQAPSPVRADSKVTIRATSPVISMPKTVDAAVAVSPAASAPVTTIPLTIEAPVSQTPVLPVPTAAVLTEVPKITTASMFKGSLPFIFITGVIVVSVYKLFIENKRGGKR